MNKKDYKAVGSIIRAGLQEAIELECFTADMVVETIIDEFVTAFEYGDGGFNLKAFKNSIRCNFNPNSDEQLAYSSLDHGWVWLRTKDNAVSSALPSRLEAILAHHKEQLIWFVPKTITEEISVNTYKKDV